MRHEWKSKTGQLTGPVVAVQGAPEYVLTSCEAALGADGAQPLIGTPLLPVPPHAFQLSFGPSQLSQQMSLKRCAHA